MATAIYDGVIETVGPLSISMPDGGDYDGFPVMARGIDEEGKPLRTGYLPATTLRGFLRRAAVLKRMRAAAAAGEHYDLPRTYAELIGQDARSEQQAGGIDLQEIRRMREDSPVIDLFGSGLGVKSRLRVGHFLPETNVLPEKFSGVRKDLGDTDGVIGLLTEAEAERYLGREGANRRRAQAEELANRIKRDIRSAERKGGDTGEREQELAEAEKLAARYKAEMGDMAVSSRTLVQHHALPAGLALKGRIVILDAQDRDLDTIEYGLDCLSRNPVLGAQSARGCGEIKGRFALSVDGAEKKLVTVGGYAGATVDSL